MLGGLTILKVARLTWPIFSLALVLLVIVAVVSALGNPVIEDTVIEALIKLVVVIGLYIFIGHSGIISFGSIAYMAIGAYATAWQTCCPQFKPMTMTGLPEFLRENTIPVLPAAITSGTLAAAVALVVGIPIMRLSGIAASIATFAILAIVNVVYSNWQTVTLGTMVVVGLPIYVDMWVAYAWVLVALVIAYVYQSSRLGLALRAAKQDETAAVAGGINIPAQRLVAWVLSAFIVGIGGVLYGHYLGIITVGSFFLDMTFITLAMLVIGGMSSLAGAVVGVITVSTFAELLRQVERGVEIGPFTLSAPSGLQEVGLGMLMLGILLWRPNGITGGKEVPWLWGGKDSRGVE